MKTEVPTNGERNLQEREHRHRATTSEYERNGSAQFDEARNRSGDKKTGPLFRRPGVIVVAAALAIAGIGYGAFTMSDSFTDESTDDAFIDAHII